MCNTLLNTNSSEIPVDYLHDWNIEYLNSIGALWRERERENNAKAEQTEESET
jgi:hypothetical protein